MTDNDKGWETRWAKEWKRLDMVAFAYGKTLAPRLKLAEERYERLSESALEYERETEETPETFARLNRLIGIADRANDAAQRLEERIEIAQKIASLHEDEHTERRRKVRR